MVDESTPADKIPHDHLAYAALHRETQGLIKKLQSELEEHIKDESNAFHDVTDIQTRLANGDARMSRIESSILENHIGAVTDRQRMEEMLQENTNVTNEIREIIEGGKSFFKWVGRAASLGRKVILWILPVVTAVLSFWYVITGQHK